MKENHEQIIIIKKEDNRGGAGELYNKKGETEKEVRNTSPGRKRGERKEAGMDII